MQHLVPKYEFALLVLWLLGHVLLQLVVEVNLQVAIVLRPQFLQLFLTVSVVLPLVNGAFVTPQVDLAKGEDACEFVNHIVGKLHGARVRHIYHIGRHALVQPHLVWVLRVAG